MDVSGVGTDGATRLQADTVGGRGPEASAKGDADFKGGPASRAADTESETGAKAGVTGWETNAMGLAAGTAGGTGLLMGPDTCAKGATGFTSDASGLRAGSAGDMEGATGAEMCAKGGITD